MGRSKAQALRGCYITLAGTPKNHTFALFIQWIKANGGKYESKISDHTTHLVIAKKVWQSQLSPVPEVLQINRNFNPEIKIVSYDWLEDSLTDKSKKGESAYLWEKLDPTSMKQANKAQNSKNKVKANSQEDEIQGPKNAQGMLAEVLKESTDDFINDREKKEIEKHAEHRRRAQEQLDEEEKERRAALKKNAAVFKMGVKKARNDIFSDNHHVYADETGFKYDVQLTKVDTRHNTNERWALTLQIYESNCEPYTYAMNAQFASTGNTATNNILAAIGCNFPTAFRVFKNTFKEHTGVDWNNRITHALERNKRERLERGRATGSDAGTVRGVPVSESATRPQAKTDEEFAKMPFLYHPPAYGSRGALPDSGEGRAPPLAEAGDANQELPTETEKVETWMSGANGAVAEESQEPQPSPSQMRIEPELAWVEGPHSNEADLASGAVPEQSDGKQATVLNDPMEFDFGSIPPALNDNTINLVEPTRDTDNETSAKSACHDYQDTQDAGETQLATEVRDEFEEFMDKAIYGHAKGAPTPIPTSPQQLDRSSPVKRRSPWEDDGEQNLRTKSKRAEVEESLENA